jgi:hypothetical protein
LKNFADGYIIAGRYGDPLELAERETALLASLEKD